MTLKLAQGWQVMLADLSLILFLTTAASLASETPTAELVGAQADPVGVFRAGGEVRLEDWLAMRATDPRETLTIRTMYAPGEREPAIARAAALATEAAEAGIEARILIEPGAASETLALFAFTGEPQVARDVHVH